MPFGPIASNCKSFTYNSPSCLDIYQNYIVLLYTLSHTYEELTKAYNPYQHSFFHKMKEAISKIILNITKAKHFNKY